MSSLPKIARTRSTRQKNLWFERSLAILASLNLGLVLFDLSYVPWRDFWLRGTIQVLDATIKIPLPPITPWYDPIKGIEPHRDTQQYLNTVNAFEQQVMQTGLQSPQADSLLQELRSLSTDMIETNPFQVADKSGTLERIKNRMRDHIYANRSSNRQPLRIGQRANQSSRQAFDIFWSQDHLSDAGLQEELAFFNSQIQPLIATNYFRHTGENGELADYFWIIDLPFVLIFGLEFLSRTFYISRRHTGVSWLDAMLWRWYDIFLLLPFWRWLRVVPVTIRLNQAHLIDLERIRTQANHGFVANFAEELTEVVVVQVINQAQGAIRRGDVASWLFHPKSRPSYIDINDTNETEAIASILIKLVVYQVLPKVKPDIEAILRHNIDSILTQSPLYKNLQNMPGLEGLYTQLTDKLATEVTQSAYNALVASLEDPVGAELTNQLVQHFSDALGSQVQEKQTLQQIETLLSELLEEVKLNYVKRLEQADIEALMEQTRQLRQSVQP
jgi:hypothetical protein